MKAIKIYAKDSKFYMEDLGNNTTQELTVLVDDGKTLKLPENSANRQYCSVKKALEGIQLEYKETKTIGPRNPKSPKVTVNLEEYLTDEEKAELEKHRKAINDIYTAANERAKKDIQMAELAAILATLTPEEIAKLMGKA